MERLETRWTKFKDLPIGKEFYWGGNRCRKKSSRTAWIYLSLGCRDGLPATRGGQIWFYFGQNDSVTADLPIVAKC